MTNKILGIDHGEARIGLAVSDSSKMLAIPYKRIKNDQETFDKLRQICIEEGIEKIVLGLPLAMAGNDTKQTEIVRRFAQKIKENLELEVIFEDERLTTKMISPIFDKRERDVQSAVIILQSYLDKLTS